MNEQANKKKHSGGRKPKKDPLNFRYTVNFNAEENVKFLSMFRESEMKNLSRFISHVLLNKPIKVIKIDRNTYDYYTLLSGFYSQFQAIGVNYNQIVKTLKTNFSEKKALILLYKLEKATIELVKVNREIIRITKEYEEKWLQK